jgi:hypothetical protein
MAINSIEDIPTIESAGRLGRRPEPGSPISEAFSARQARGGMSIGSIGLSMGMDFVRLLQERVFPSGTQLAALQMAGIQPTVSPSYTTHYDCTTFNYDGTCNEACFGFAPHHMDPFYCATCDEQAADPTNNPPWNWHFVGSRGSLQYIDREPDVCVGRDAWKWSVGACGNCSESAVFRCHDGYKKYPANDYWDPTICQGIVSCDGNLSLCP